MFVVCAVGASENQRQINFVFQRSNNLIDVELQSHDMKTLIDCEISQETSALKHHVDCFKHLKS